MQGWSRWRACTLFLCRQGPAGRVGARRRQKAQALQGTCSPHDTPTREAFKSHVPMPTVCARDALQLDGQARGPLCHLSQHSVALAVRQLDTLAGQLAAPVFINGSLQGFQACGHHSRQHLMTTLARSRCLRTVRSQKAGPPALPPVRLPLLAP